MIALTLTLLINIIISQISVHSNFVLRTTGPDNLANLKKIAEQYQRRESIPEGDEEEDDVPELVEGQTFEEAAKDE